MTFMRPKGGVPPISLQQKAPAGTELQAYGTPEGVRKGWLKRQRGRKRRPAASRPPEAWMSGRLRSLEQEGVTGKEALHRMTTDWNEQGRLGRQWKRQHAKLVQKRRHLMQREIVKKSAPKQINLETRHIDTGFYRVSGKEAAELVRNSVSRFPGSSKLPKHGFERRVLINGQPAWLTRTVTKGKRTWAVYGIGR